MTPPPVTASPGLEGLPQAGGHCARVYGVDYRILDDGVGGTLYVTPYGLPVLDALQPDRWFTGQRYATDGRKLAGTVYRLPGSSRGRPLPLVIKFSRFAQDVPLDVRSTFDGLISQQAIEDARFLDPFQEFGLLSDLRRGRFGPQDLRIRTKRPLAIYRAPDPEPAWRLGRSKAELRRVQRQIASDQSDATAPVTLDPDRLYVLLFHWVEGLNLLEALQAGLIDEDEVTPITRQVACDLEAKGFLVLDHKPQHVIVRPVDGGLLRRHGKVVYAIIDFELLERTEAYREHRAARDKSA